MNENKGLLFSRKISIWHVIYLVILTFTINIFLFVICPGKVNDEAMSNISFASAIVSIVLALVSIIYTLQSGVSSANRLEGIKNIEDNIHEELYKFRSLRDTISEYIDPIRKTVGDIQKTAGDIQRAQDDMKKNIDGLFDSVKIQVSDKSNNNKKDLNLNHIMVVSLYAAAKSKDTGMDIPFHIFANYVGPQAHYSEGLLEGLAMLSNDIKIEKGSAATRKKTTTYVESSYGTLDELRNKAITNPNKRLGVDFIGAIDKYFSDIKNQQVKDSVG